MMIEINLVPESLRKDRNRRAHRASKLTIPREIVVGFFGGLVVLLFIAHLILLLAVFTKFAYYKKLKLEWDQSAPQREAVNEVLAQLRSSQGKIAAVEGVVKTKRPISWAQKLNIVSDCMPRGIWLNKIALSEKFLLVEGSALSKDADGMASASDFSAALKNSKDFMPGFKSIEMGTIERRAVKTTEIVDFAMTIQLDEK